MPALSKNSVIQIVRGIVHLDVSTPMYPDAVALINESDLHNVVDGCGRWCAVRSKRENVFYVRRHGDGLLHRWLLGLDKADQGDHRNGNGLDNRRRNLRPASNLQNSWNRARRKNGTSKYKGVSWDKERQQWTASIRHEDRAARKSLGRYASEIDAACAYDMEALRRYGEFAYLNFPRKKNG